MEQPAHPHSGGLMSSDERQLAAWLCNGQQKRYEQKKWLWLTDVDVELDVEADLDVTVLVCADVDVEVRKDVYVSMQL